MRVLLDECVDPDVVLHFQRHVATGCVAAGLTSLANGELLRAAEPEFDAFVTVDKGILYQQNLAAFDLAFVFLRIGSNRAEAIAPFVPRIEELLDHAEKGSFHTIE